MKLQRYINLIKVKKVKKLLKQILAELVYARKCRLKEMQAQGITPPPGEPNDPEPDN